MENKCSLSFWGGTRNQNPHIISDVSRKELLYLTRFELMEWVARLQCTISF